jgi:predicted Zn finger-like uncharacterized protein
LQGAAPYKRSQEIVEDALARMIVVCPQCRTRYLVDPRALGADGRRVRCAQCSHIWHHKPPPEALAELETVAPPPEPESPPAEERVEPQFERPPLEEEAGARRIQLPALAEPRRRPWLALGWAVLLVVVGLAAGGAVWERDAVIRAWPPSARLYSLFGLAVPQPGDVLKVTAQARRDEENGVPRLVIEGEVANISPEAQQVPKLKVELTDAGKRVVQSWSFDVSTERLLPGASVPFTTSIARPNESATGMSVTFTGDGG